MHKRSARFRLHFYVWAAAIMASITVLKADGSVGQASKTRCRSASSVGFPCDLPKTGVKRNCSGAESLFGSRLAVRAGYLLALFVLVRIQAG